MLADFDKACGKIGLQLNLKKTMFMKNGLVSFAPFTLNGTNISECSGYVYLDREINTMNDLAPELSRRKRAAWGAFNSIEDVVKRTKNTRLRAHLFDSTVLPVLTYASETWSLRKQDERSLSVIERAVEWTMLGVSRFTQVRDGIRSSDLRQRSKTTMLGVSPASHKQDERSLSVIERSVERTMLGVSRFAQLEQDERSLSVIERAVERTMLGVSRFTQVRDGIRSSDLRQRSKIKDAVLYAKQSKIRWAGHVMRMNDNRWTYELLVTGFLGISNVLHENHRPDGRSSSRRA
uniref:Reverse transcriptase domain-containing protein n=1 Tax=Angiostrongylus cantonensis TaxID=6313 RepID=A0A0K0D4T4_ANGCA